MPQAQDAITLARSYLAEMNSQGADSDAKLLLWADRAQKQLVSDTLWPPSKIQIALVPNQQTYDDVPLVYETLQVYVAGLPIIPRDLDTLEGMQIQYYDASGMGTGPDGTPNAPFTPQWSAQPAVSYPTVPGQMGAPISDAAPWSIGNRPAFFWRGADFGLIPPPSNGTTFTDTGAMVSPYMTIFAVKHPCTLKSLQDHLVIADDELDAVAWLICFRAYYADRNDDVKTLRSDAWNNYLEERRRIRSRIFNYGGRQVKGPVVETYRGAYQTGNVRNGYRGGYGRGV